MKRACPACGKHQCDDTNTCHHCGYILQADEKWGCKSKRAKAYIKWLQGLLAYLPYFRLTTNVPKYENSCYPDYTGPIDDFIYGEIDNFNEEFGELTAHGYERGMAVYLEHKVLLRRIPHRMVSEKCSEFIKEQDVSGLISLMVYILRGEHWCDGYIESHVEKGSFTAILERLKFLLKELGINTDVQSIAFAVRFYSVAFNNSTKLYAYRSDDKALAVGDEVLVPIGADNEECTAVIRKIEMCHPSDTPYPYGKMKKIIGRV